MKPPTAIPFKLKNNVPGANFEGFVESYSIVMGTLNELKNQYDQTKRIIVQLIDPEGRKVDDEKAEGSERAEGAVRSQYVYTHQTNQELDLATRSYVDLVTYAFLLFQHFGTIN